MFFLFLFCDALHRFGRVYFTAHTVTSCFLLAALHRRGAFFPGHRFHSTVSSGCPQPFALAISCASPGYRFRGVCDPAGKLAASAGLSSDHFPFLGLFAFAVTKQLQFKLSSRDKYRLGGQPRCVTLIAASSGRSSASSAASAADSYSGGSAFAGPPLFLTPDHLPSLCRLRHE